VAFGGIFNERKSDSNQQFIFMNPVYLIQAI
jgi:hypothetical protein